MIVNVDDEYATMMDGRVGGKGACSSCICTKNRWQARKRERCEDEGKCTQERESHARETMGTRSKGDKGAAAVELGKR
jgi:hypothetical protein